MTQYTYALLLIFLAPVFFLNLGGYGLLYNNEGLYAQIPVEMLQSGNYIIPYLNGVPYIEKPPLLYWLIALSYKLFGISESTARLVPAMSGLSLVAITGAFIQRNLGSRQAFQTTLILGTSIGLCVLARTILFDVVFSLFLAAGLYAFYENRLRWAYVWLALAVMTKGFVAVALGGLFILTYFLLLRMPLRTWFKILDLIGILLFILIIAPWHILASMQEPGFAWFYFINEHILRFLGLRTPHDYYQGPIYYYVFRILLCVFPWSLFIWLFFIRSTKSLAPPTFKTFLWTWFGVFLMFFSLSKAKANYYLITALTPLIILLTLKIEETWEKTRSYLVGITAFIGPLLPLLGLLSCCWNAKFALINPYWFLGWLGLNCIPFYYLWKHRTKSVAILLFLGFQSWILLIETSLIISQFEHQLSPKSIIQPFLGKHHEVCLYKDYEKISPVLFYLKSAIPIIDSGSNDLRYGQDTRRRPDLFITHQEMPHRCRIVFVHQEQLHEFTHNFPSYQFAQSNDKVFVFEKSSE